MMGTAAASLSGRSSAAWPPRLKIPTRYPVLPRLRVGMAFGVAGFEGSVGSVAAAAGRAACATRPAVIAPLVFRKSRRLVGIRSELDSPFIEPSGRQWIRALRH